MDGSMNLKGGIHSMCGAIPMSACEAGPLHDLMRKASDVGQVARTTLESARHVRGLLYGHRNETLKTGLPADIAASAMEAQKRVTAGMVEDLQFCLDEILDCFAGIKQILDEIR